MLDILFCIFLVMAIYKGYSKGFIVAIFSYLALLIGLAMAIKFSIVVARWIKPEVHMSAGWISFVSFLLVMVVVVLLVRLVGNILQKTAELLFIGWINRLAGVLLYILLYMTMFSVVLYFAEKIHLIRVQTLHESVTYRYIAPLGPMLLNGLGKIIPFFGNMFMELKSIFGPETKTSGQVFAAVFF